MSSHGFKPGKIWLDRELIMSQAFMSLTGAAPHVLLHFMGKRKFDKNKKRGRKTEYLPSNNGQIEYTYKEAVRAGITRPRFTKAIDQLVSMGFIDITHQGSGGVKGDKSTYAISERWRNYGTDEFEKKERPKDTRKGCGFSAIWEKRRNEGIQAKSAKKV